MENNDEYTIGLIMGFCLGIGLMVIVVAGLAGSGICKI